MSRSRFSVCIVRVLAALVLLGVVVSARAQDSDARLGLDEALQLAAERSRALVAQDAAAAAVRDLAVAAGERPDPMLTAGIDNLPINGADSFSLTRDFMTMRSIGVMQELTRADKGDARATRYERAVQAADAERLLALRDLQRDTALAWLDRYHYERILDVLVDQRAEALLQIEAADIAYRNGLGAQSDVFAARSVVAEIDNRIALAERDVEVAAIRLSRWIGDAAGRALAELLSIDVVPVLAEDLEADVARHPMLAVLATREEVARADAEVARANATGIKSPVGIKVAGTSLEQINATTMAIERVVRSVPGVTSAFAERLTGGRYIDVEIDRDAAARFALNVADVQSVVSSAIGGANIGETVEGLARFPINVRYPREVRDSIEELRQLPIVTPRGAHVVLGDVASVSVIDGPPMLKSENARLAGWVYVDVRGRDLSAVVRDMQEVVAARVELPPGYSIAWSGQFEYLERATARLMTVVPVTLLIIVVLLYLIFRRFDEALLIMATLPFALIGGIWLLYFLDYDLSVAGAVGFIALAGVAAEFGVVMLLYLRHAWDDRCARGPVTARDLDEAVREGAVLRVRPKAMTVAVIVAGLMPIMWGTGTGSEVMQRIAAPMVGGMITAPLLSMLVIPAAYLLLRRPRRASPES